MRIPRESLTTFLLSIVGFYPYRCRRCATLTHRWQRDRGASLAAFVLLFAASSFSIGVLLWKKGPKSRAAAPAPVAAPAGVAEPRFAVGRKGATADPQTLTVEMERPLRNDDIVRLSRAGVAGNVILKAMAKMPHSFEVDAESLIKLTQSGVPPTIISSMIDSMAQHGSISAAGHLEARRLLPSLERKAKAVSASFSQF
ncbi:MAG: hypothetical protein NTV70_10790 [Acidobacteria bacterium]|nr:hypothetical protein [Acidobacteriota bacterium]